MMKEDFDWIKKVISHPDNRLVHWSAIKRLINNFERKHSDSKRVDVFSNYLRLLLKKERI